MLPFTIPYLSLPFFWFITDFFLPIPLYILFPQLYVPEFSYLHMLVVGLFTSVWWVDNDDDAVIFRYWIFFTTTSIYKLEQLLVVTISAQRYTHSSVQSVILTFCVCVINSGQNFYPGFLLLWESVNLAGWLQNICMPQKSVLEIMRRIRSNYIHHTHTNVYR